MERLTKACENTENGKYISYIVDNFKGIYPDCTLGKVVERLAYYENLEEEGRLIVLSVEDIHPCKNCGVGWGSISSDGCKSCHDSCDRLKQYNENYKNVMF